MTPLEFVYNGFGQGLHNGNFFLILIDPYLNYLEQLTYKLIIAQYDYSD